MVTPEDCIKKYGLPTPEFEHKWMGMYLVPEDVHRACVPIPLKLYCNKDFAMPFMNALKQAMKQGVAHELIEYGGVFNIRLRRGSTTQYSIHSWAIAVDLNMTTNALGAKPQMSKELVKCFTDNGFEWGGNWKRKDGMHFQLASI